MKRIILILSAVLCLAALTCSVSAAKDPTLSPEQQVVQDALAVFEACKVSARRESFRGYCGTMTSHQLYHMGINSWLAIMDGNKQFDYYAARDMTSGGYYTTAYYADDYPLEDALQLLCANGTRDVYNILVGFETTDTEAGAIYGHSLVINAILDGYVYFMESYDSNTTGKEGTVAKLTVKAFANYYSQRGVYEGVVHFGSYLDACNEYASDVYLLARFDTVVRSRPGVVGQEDTKQLRSVKAGERIQATRLVRSPQGDWFYKVENGYIAAAAVAVTETCGDGLTLEGFVLPEQIEENVDIDLVGTVTGGDVAAVSVAVIDINGDIFLRERELGNDLSALNEWLFLDLLPAGRYWVEVTAEAASAVIQNGSVERSYFRKAIHYAPLQVGEVSQGVLPAIQQSANEGWVRREGVWYLYRYGFAQTGWQKEMGVRYYLQSSGATLTGWQKMDDGIRFFTPAGAMVTGWMVTDQGDVFLDEDGLLYSGTVTLEDKTYTYLDGVLQ